MVHNPCKILKMPKYWWFEVSWAHYFAAHLPITPFPFSEPPKVTAGLFLVVFDQVWVKEVISEGKRSYFQISKTEAAEWLVEQNHISLIENVDEFLQSVYVPDDIEFLNRHRPPEPN